MNRSVYLKLSTKNKILRTLWFITCTLLYTYTPNSFHRWRSFILKVFGAKLGKCVHPYPKAKVWAPWNLTMGDYACIANYVDCYNVAPITIGERTTISQYSVLCSASHDYSRSTMPLVVAPIVIGDYVWITYDVFVGPGVTINDGGVVTVRSTVLNDLPAWFISKGNPAVATKARNFVFDD